MQAARQAGESLDCLACESRRPEVAAENVPAWEVWAASQTQWVTGLNGPIGLNYPAVWLVAEALGVEMHAANLGRIRALEIAALKKARGNT